MSSSAHIDNQKKDILVLDDVCYRVRTYANCRKKCIQLILLLQRKHFCLSLVCNGANSYLFVNRTKIHKFKAKESEILVGPMCLGNTSKDWSVGNMKRTGFTGYVLDFSVDFPSTAVDDTKNIHKYLMKKYNIVW